MASLGKKLAFARNKQNLTQAVAAEHLGLTFQSVSSWERGETSPSIDMLPKIADLYNVSIDWLLREEDTTVPHIDFDKGATDRIFDEIRMYTYIGTYANVKNLSQTLSVLEFARDAHKGQIRRGNDHVPYIYHPLLVACHALALGLDDDNIISAALLHDVCEDCNILVDALPVNETTKEIVKLLTKSSSINKPTGREMQKYYDAILSNPQALLIKLLDRCNNISSMASGFSNQEIVDYVNETETYFFPMMRKAKKKYPLYSNLIFLIKYHMVSVIGSLKHQMQHEE